MNSTINDRVPPLPRIDPPDVFVDTPVPHFTEVRSYRHKLINDATLATRARQHQFAQDKRFHAAEVRAAEADHETQQIEAARAEAARDAVIRAQKVRDLRDTYHAQLDDIALREQREHQSDLEYERYLAAQGQEKDREEAAKQARRRRIDAAERAEFLRLNQELQKRKEERIEEDLARERVTMRQAGEISEMRDARAAEDVRRRDELNAIRGRVGAQRARELARQSQTVAVEEPAAYSVVEDTRRSQVMALKFTKEQMAETRHGEWMEHQKEKSARRKEGRSQPFPSRRKGVDVEEYNRTQRRLESGRLQTYLGGQADEKREREARAREESLEQDRQMLAYSQAKFNESLRKVQALVPPDSGIKMPAYTVSRSVMHLN
jgi:hypothetical protein